MVPRPCYNFFASFSYSTPWCNVQLGLRTKLGKLGPKQVYKKREAASAIALSAEGSQEEEKEKSKRQANSRNWRRMSITGGDRLDKDWKAAHTAWLSMWKMTWNPRNCSPHRKTACKTAKISFN